MKKAIELNSYKESKIDEAFEKSDEIYAEFQADLARYGMRIDNGAAITENDTLAIMAKMAEMHEANVRTRETIDKYKIII